MTHQNPNHGKFTCSTCECKGEHKTNSPGNMCEIKPLLPCQLCCIAHDIVLKCTGQCICIVLISYHQIKISNRRKKITRMNYMHSFLGSFALSLSTGKIGTCPMAAAARVGMARYTPKVLSMASPAWMSTELSTKPKATKGTAECTKRVRSVEVEGRLSPATSPCGRRGGGRIKAVNERAGERASKRASERAPRSEGFRHSKRGVERLFAHGAPCAACEHESQIFLLRSEDSAQQFRQKDPQQLILNDIIVG